MKKVEMSEFKQKTLDALEEARRISRDPAIKGYTSMDELKKALELEAEKRQFF